MEENRREEILDLIEEEDVEFIRLQFTDMCGNMKNIAITAGQMEKAFCNHCVIEGAPLPGFGGGSGPFHFRDPAVEAAAGQGGTVYL